MTRFGMKEKDMQAVAGLMAEVIKYGRAVKEEAARLRGRFLELGYCFKGEELKALQAELLSTF